MNERERERGEGGKEGGRRRGVVICDDGSLSSWSRLFIRW